MWNLASEPRQVRLRTARPLAKWSATHPSQSPRESRAPRRACSSRTAGPPHRDLPVGASPLRRRTHCLHANWENAPRGRLSPRKPRPDMARGLRSNPPTHSGSWPQNTCPTWKTALPTNRPIYGGARRRALTSLPRSRTGSPGSAGCTAAVDGRGAPNAPSRTLCARGRPRPLCARDEPTPATLSSPSNQPYSWSGTSSCLPFRCHLHARERPPATDPDHLSHSGPVSVFVRQG